MKKREGNKLLKSIGNKAFLSLMLCKVLMLLVLGCGGSEYNPEGSASVGPDGSVGGAISVDTVPIMHDATTVNLPSQDQQAPAPAIATISGPLKAFPGAQGFGTETPGGRGGQIIKVTNLNDSGAGSLRAAVQASGPRIVVFEVGGYINLQNELAITNPYITIAGQTAPAPGITLRNRRLRIGTHDVVLQHIKSRPGDTPGVFDEYDDRDSLTIQDFNNDIYNVVVDHCSLSWAVDEVVGIWGYQNKRLSDITISNSIVSEGLNVSLKGVSHSKGFLVGDYAKKVAVLDNLVVSNQDRNGPLFKGGTSGVVANNFVYNAGLSYRLAFADDYNAGPSYVSAQGNVWQDGPAYSTSGPVWLNSNVKQGTAIFLSDNRTLRRDGSVAQVAVMQSNVVWGNPQVQTPPVSVPGLAVKPSSAVEVSVLASAGARPAERFVGIGDPVDERIVTEVKGRAGRIINSVAEGGGWPVFSETRRTFTIPANPNGDDNGNGYTNIEEVLYQMAIAVERR